MRGQRQMGAVRGQQQERERESMGQQEESTGEG